MSEHIKPPLLPPHTEEETTQRTRNHDSFYKTIGFLQVAFGHGAAESLPERDKWLMIRYVTDPSTTQDALKNYAGITTGQRVGQIVKDTLAKVWESTPPDIQARYPREHVLLSRKAASAETKAKMSTAHQGKPGTMTGKHLPAETRAKMSIAQKGRKVSAETRAKMQAAQRMRRDAEKNKKSIQ